MIIIDHKNLSYYHRIIAFWEIEIEIDFQLFQYIIPITVILFTHTKIIGIVRQRTTRTTSLTGSARAEVTMRRNKKTTQVYLRAK